jgi:hypothetical protein
MAVFFSESELKKLLSRATPSLQEFATFEPGWGGVKVMDVLSGDARERRKACGYKRGSDQEKAFTAFAATISNLQIVVDFINGEGTLQPAGQRLIVDHRAANEHFVIPITSPAADLQLVPVLKRKTECGKTNSKPAAPASTVATQAMTVNKNADLAVITFAKDMFANIAEDTKAHTHSLMLPYKYLFWFYSRFLIRMMANLVLAAGLAAFLYVAWEPLEAGKTVARSLGKVPGLFAQFMMGLVTELGNEFLQNLGLPGFQICNHLAYDQAEANQAASFIDTKVPIAGSATTHAPVAPPSTPAASPVFQHLVNMGYILVVSYCATMFRIMGVGADH